MTTNPAISTSDLVLTLIAVRLAAMVAVCLIVLAVPARPHNPKNACGTVEVGMVQLPEGWSDIDAAFQDMLRHD